MGAAAGESTSTVGQLFQEARTAKGLTIEAAADGSKVPLSFVRLMEQEQFHLVPDPLYLARFLTEYATFLGLDPKQVKAQLQHQLDVARASRPSYPASSLGSRIDLPRLLPYLLPAVVAIPLIFIGLSLLSGRPPAQPPQKPPPLESQQTAAPTPETGTANLPGPQATAAPAGQPEGVNPARPLTDPAVQGPQSPPPRYALKAEAKQTTWLAVAVDGAPRKEVLLRPGQTAQWSADRGFVVTIGNSEGVALSLNGKPVSLKGGGGQVIRDLTLPGGADPMTAR